MNKKQEIKPYEIVVIRFLESFLRKLRFRNLVSPKKSKTLQRNKDRINQRKIK